ncbi:HD domain-containing protein [Cellulosimicrobium sp. Marseille-Q8652]
MGVTSIDAPQWFLSSFVRSARGAGATAPEEAIRAVGQGLLDRWDTPGRNFHNLRHLADVLGRVDELSQETHDPDLVRLAAWYHGAVFDAKGRATYANKGGEDETASAALAQAELTDLGVPADAARRVAQLVNALVRHAPDPTDFDCAVLCDADLAMLAAEPQRYKEYLKDVRDEYAHIPPEDYVRARMAILTKLLERRSLFSSPLGAAWEEPARQNLDAELQRLRKEQIKLAQRSTPSTTSFS